MIWITGDCHSDFRKFSTNAFPEQKEMNRDDCMIICGDFGGIWSYAGETKEEKYWLDWLEDKSYTTLFVDGNHECFPRLYSYPEKKWHGGLVHEIRPHVLHLCRGQVFEIDGKKIFTFGGARSHDIQGGVLELDDPDIYKKKHELDRQGICYRVNLVSWWKEEMPNAQEMAIGLMNLEENNYEVDYIVSHDAPASTVALFGHGLYKTDELNEYLETVRQKTNYKRWFFGHYHYDWAVNDKDILLFDQIIRIA